MFLRLLLSLGALGLASPALGFLNIHVGDPVKNLELQSSDGKTESLLAHEKANVIIFFRPDQPHSQTIAARIADTIEPEMAQKSVHFVALISGRYGLEAIQTFRVQTGLKMPILIDREDLVLGKFGVILHPSVGIVNSTQVLAAYQHFTEIGFLDVFRGQIRFLLGEITEKELQDIIAPSQQQINENRRKAQSRLALARILLRQNRIERATAEVQMSLSYDDTLAEAHSFYGHLLFVTQNCKKALEEFDIALKLDPQNREALQGQQDCQGTF